MRETVIDGRFYSVDTATLLGTVCNRYPMTDPRYYEEALYCKNSGEHFLSVCGGAQSKYASVNGAGSAIIPLTLEEAFAWCESNYNASARNLDPSIKTEGGLGSDQ